MAFYPLSSSNYRIVVQGGSIVEIMPLEFIEDWEMRLKRQDAFWLREIVDRPPVMLEYAIDSNFDSSKKASHVNYYDAWTDIDYQVNRTVQRIKNTRYFGDSLPIAFPDLGPDYFCSLFGGSLRFMQDTSYIEPFVNDYQEIRGLATQESNVYARIMATLYEAFLQAGKGLFHTGIPDIHPGADCLVGMRGPEQLCLDLLEQPDAVVHSLRVIGEAFQQVYLDYANGLMDQGQLCTGWPQIVSSHRWHVPCCDFSYLVSNSMFEEFFLEPLIEEMKLAEYNIYHLDGPGALRHLDSLLGLDSLDAVQWVHGAGNGSPADQIVIYKKIQKANKGIQIMDAGVKDVPILTEHLDPHGVWLKVEVKNEDEARWVLSQVEAWGKRRK
jgi:hypothetical protein